MHNFGERETEFHSKLGNVLVWRSPKYEEARKKAVEIIDSGKYALTDADFWILMNATKSGKMAYTGLIISHNGCLKINDSLESKFKPECVTFDKEGYNGSLVFHYCCPEQGIYEVGEVSKSNCQNDYPYAMAYKRMFDRVVLKLSKLAYAGIYSDSESDEFTQRLEAAEGAPYDFSKGSEVTPPAAEKRPDGNPFASQKCSQCNTDLEERVADYSKSKYGRFLCRDCQKKWQR